jgi:hypothetical protein
MRLCARQIEHLAGHQVMPRAACRKGNSTFQALDRDFSGRVMFRNVLSEGITKRMISNVLVFTKVVVLACANTDPSGRISITSPDFACGMATVKLLRIECIFHHTTH